MDTGDNNLHFLDILINKQGNKIWMNTYSKEAYPKRYVPFNPNHLKPCLKGMPPFV